MRRFLLPCCLALVVSLTALAQTNLLIYTDNLVNAFQDNSSATVIFTNTSPVHSGSYSVSVKMNNLSDAVYFRYGPSFDTRPYSNISFWINGGPTGGQQLKLIGDLADADQAGPFALSPLPTNSWQQVTVPLLFAGLAGKTNCTGFKIANAANGSQAIFYIDDVQIGASPAPSPVQLKVNATNTIRMADGRWFGVNTATWDGNLGLNATLTALKAAGALALRFPGGSTADEYHWQTDPGGNASFLKNMTNLGTNASAVVTVNYGSGTSNEAAAWVLSANVTNHGHFKYWEIGNECFGSWETDTNSPAHDPFTYAKRAANYMTLMRAADPTISIGVVAVAGDDMFVNNTSHPATNSRTGQIHFGWTPVMLSTFKNSGVRPDFLIYHYYPQFTPTPVSTNPPSPSGDSDPLLLQVAKNWASDAATLRQEISDYYGASGTNIELLVTENNSDSTGGGRQLSSLVDALYMADSMSQLMKTEFNSYLWWDLRNSADNTGNFDPSLYGWRPTGDFGLIQGVSSNYPAYYSFKLMQNFVRPGDTVLNATSSYLLLSAYASRKADGALALLVINKDPIATFTGQITLTNFTPDTNAVVRSYGMLQDNAERFNLPAKFLDIATNNLSVPGAQFTDSFQAYSLTLFTFSPAAPQLHEMAASPGKFVFQIQGQAQTPYVIQTSTNMKTWTAVSTNFLTNTTMLVTNSISGTGPQFIRAVWMP